MFDVPDLTVSISLSDNMTLKYLISLNLSFNICIGKIIIVSLQTVPMRVT